MDSPRHRARRTGRLVGLAALAAMLVPPVTTAVAQDEPDDPYFESPFDGGWVGTVEAGGDHVPFQLNLNVGDDGGIAFLIMGNGDATALEVFAGEFTRVQGNQLNLEFDDEAPLAAGLHVVAGRFATTEFKLQYDAADDALGGKVTGEQNADLLAVSMSPELPLQRLWQTTVKSGGEESFIQLALMESEDGTIGGFALVNDESGVVSGQRNGANVEFDMTGDGGTISFSGKLKRKDNQLKGRIDTADDRLKAKFVTADGDGKPMKLRKVQRRAAVDTPAGQQTEVKVVGKNIALGALVHVDHPDVSVDSVELANSKQMIVTLTADASIAADTRVGLRLFNADGEIGDKGNALTVVGDDDGGAPPISFTAQVLPILETNCALVGCHSLASAEEGLVLAAGSAHSNIVGVPSAQQPALLRVAPGNPNDSYLVRKIEGGPGINGGRMPLDRTPLTAAQIQTIRDWISQGAPNNRVGR